MRKFFPALLALGFMLSAATTAGANPDKHRGAGAHASTMGQTMSRKCAPGKSWTHGYTRKNGTKVKGYCK